MHGRLTTKLRKNKNKSILVSFEDLQSTGVFCDKQEAERTHGQADGNSVIGIRVGVPDVLPRLPQMVAETRLGTVPHNPLFPAHHHCAEQ